MRLAHALLAIVDISGYTRFITQRTTSLLHAEQIVTELLDSVIDKAEYPLRLNKLQGDAALLYREFTQDDAEPAARDALRQLGNAFAAFAACRERLSSQRSGCSCEACSNIASLGLKAFVHAGEIAIKQVRQFEELAGEPVIFVHRLLKNRVEETEYVLLSGPVQALLGAGGGDLREHQESVDGFGEQTLWLMSVSNLPVSQESQEPPPAAPSSLPEVGRRRGFRNLPHPGFLWGGWLALKRRMVG